MSSLVGRASNAHVLGKVKKSGAKQTLVIKAEKGDADLSLEDDRGMIEHEPWVKAVYRVGGLSVFSKAKILTALM